MIGAPSPSLREGPPPDDRGRMRGIERRGSLFPKEPGAAPSGHPAEVAALRGCAASMGTQSDERVRSDLESAGGGGQLVGGGGEFVACVGRLCGGGIDFLE